MNSINMALAINLSFDRPLFLILIIPVVAIFLLPFLLLPNERKKNVRKILPLVLRIVAAIILVFVIAGIKIIKATDEQVVVLLIDMSHSTTEVREEIEKNGEEIFKIVKKDSPCGVVAFGGDQSYSVNMNAEGKSFSIDAVDDKITDIEKALDYAVSLCPEDKAIRIILLSDGKQNQGNADTKAYYLANKGVKIDAMYYDTTNVDYPEVQAGKITCPDGIYKNKEAEIKAAVKSNLTVNATVRLFDNGVEIQQLQKALSVGDNALEFKVSPQSTGVHKYTLKVEGEKDTVSYNNEISCIMKVDGKSRILVVTEDVNSVSALGEVISSDSEVDFVRSFDAPSSLVTLCKYDQIIMSNVNYHVLTGKFVRSVSKYVSVYGRSLLMVGGRDTFMYGGMTGTDIERMMPVSFDFDETDSEDTVALMLVIDCSRSMGGSTNYISIAKQGAIKCLDALNDKDSAGVISFSTGAKLESPLVNADVTNKDGLTRVISGLSISSGTYYTEAVELAYEQLSQSDADIKHVIFLSDGQPTDHGYDELIIKGADQGITLSTIGLAFSSNVLEYMAMYGKGRYYYVSGVSELPNVMLSEAEQARVDPMLVGDFVPVVREENEFTKNVDFSSLPPLGGYLGTNLKDNAHAHLVSENGHPVYASWKYGEGVVACFTSDLMGTWSGGWFASDNGRRAISEMIRSTASDYHEESSVIIKAELDGNFADITVNTAGDDNRNTVKVTVEGGGLKQEYNAEMVYSGLYRVRVAVGGEGSYSVVATERDVNGNEVDKAERLVCVPYSGEYDVFAPSGKGFLSGLCSYSGGGLFDDPKKIAQAKVENINLVFDPVVPLILFALALFMVDTAVRKLRLKDILKYFGKG